MTDPAIIEAAVRALRKEALLFEFPESCTEIGKAVLAAVTPLIEAAALEKAAKELPPIPENIELPPNPYVEQPVGGGQTYTATIASIEAAALEKAAKVAEDYDGEFEEVHMAQGDIAAAIRALK